MLLDIIHVFLMMPTYSHSLTEVAILKNALYRREKKGFGIITPEFVDVYNNKIMGDCEQVRGPQTLLKS